MVSLLKYGLIVCCLIMTLSLPSDALVLLFDNNLARILVMTTLICSFFYCRPELSIILTIVIVIGYMVVNKTIYTKFRRYKRKEDISIS